jgi:hypothetical protein
LILLGEEVIEVADVIKEANRKCALCGDELKQGSRANRLTPEKDGFPQVIVCKSCYDKADKKRQVPK